MKTIALIATALVVSACTDSSTVTRAQDPALLSTNRTAPIDAQPDTCWDKHETPAVVETIVEDVLVQPAQISASGTVQSPPIYRSQSRPVILKEREDTWFQILCPSDLSADFVSSVQRALALRDLYDGSVTGQMDESTRIAISTYQTSNNIANADPRNLTIEAARQLGLWAAPREDAG